MRPIKILEILSAGFVASAVGLVLMIAPASAATKPCARNCGATMKITGVSINTPPGYYPTPAGPNIRVTASASFSKAGTDVTDFRLFVDGVLVPEADTYFGSGSVGVIYGAVKGIGLSTDSNGSEPRPMYPVSPGRHVLTTEIIGVGGAVLATSARYTVTVSKPAPVVKPKLTYTATTYNNHEPYYNDVEINLSSATAVHIEAPWVLTFTLPAGETVVTNAGYYGETITQSGTTVTVTGSVELDAGPGGSFLPGVILYNGRDNGIPLVGPVTIDGIPVSQG